MTIKTGSAAASISVPRIIAFGLSFFTLLSAIPSGAHAKDLGPYGKVNADLRYRYESVDDDARPRNGVANTVRLRLGYQTPEWEKLSAYGELETIRRLGATTFDDGLNGKTQYGRILDPSLTGINQLYVNYAYDDVSKVRIGRQALSLDNQRFVAWSKSRQNDPTHDAALFQYGVKDQYLLTYVYSMGMNRYSGNRTTAGKYEGNLNLLHAHYDWKYGLGVSGYSYFLDFTGVRAEENLSSRTHGVRITWDPKGDGWQPMASLEFARQFDFGNSTLSYAENYYSAEVGVKKGDLKIYGTIEQLGGNGKAALQSPIGSSNSLTGWNDKFTTTPVNGLRDHRLNVIIPYDLPWKDQSVELAGQYHYFTSDDGDQKYGTEAGASLTYKPVKNHAISLKYSNYQADEFSTDTTKVWVAYEYKF